PRAGRSAASRRPAARCLRRRCVARVLSAGTLPSLRAGSGGSRAGSRRAGAGHRTAPTADDAADRRMSVLVVIPTYNERGNLPDLVRAIMTLDGYRVLVVDDGSPDGTGEAADELAREFPGRVDVIHRTGLRGLGRSYVDGLRHA